MGQLRCYIPIDGNKTLVSTIVWLAMQVPGFRLDLEKGGTNYSVAFLFAASIIILAIYSSIPSSLDTDAGSV